MVCCCEQTSESHSLGRRENVAQTLAVLGSAFVAARRARILVLLTTRRVDRLAAIDRRHLAIHTLSEGWTGLILAGCVRLLAQLTLLRTACLTAVDFLRLGMHALPALRTALVSARRHDLLMGLVSCQTLFRVGGERTPSLSVHSPSAPRAWSGLSVSRSTKQGSDGRDDGKDFLHWTLLR